ncbi:hypothetical protein QUF74_13115 [Candidatus Halobeggiatoa sp. HSG11]|nr:hypothetical protein [Candidatus Halobeggiatoa sp. HSG11]
MTKQNKNISAASPESALGFSFQDVYSLYLLLKDERSDLELWIESLDDIHIKDKNGNLTLYQLKHKSNNLNDKSSDLWNTIGNWCRLIKDGNISIETTSFKLVVITEVLNTQVAYSLCKKYGSYNTIIAHDELLKIANKDIENKRNKPKKSEKQEKNIQHPDLFGLPEEQEIKETDYELFAKLHYNTRELLVKSIEVIDNAPNVTTLDARIPSMLYTVYPDNQKAVYSDLMGWWQMKIREHLSNKSVSPLPKTILTLKIAEINEKYDNGLPLDNDFKHAEYEKSIDIQNDNRRFVIYAKKIMDDDDVKYVVLDYYRAYNQRISWLNRNLLSTDYLKDYEQELQDGWNRTVRRVKRKSKFSFNTKTEKQTKKDIGIDIYDATEELDIRIKEKVTEKYIMMGSYHILADEDRVCWYPDDKMKKILN